MLQRLHRDSLTLNIPVHAEDSGLLVGRLSDLSLGGFCLAGSGRPPARELRDMALHLPWPMQGVNEIRVSVEQRWTRAAQGGRWHVGYRIVSCPEQDLMALNRLSGSFSSGNRNLR